MRLILFAAAGGALGAGLRHFINTAFLAWLGPGFPWATLTVNVAGEHKSGTALNAYLTSWPGTNGVAASPKFWPQK